MQLQYNPEKKRLEGEKKPFETNQGVRDTAISKLKEIEEGKYIPSEQDLMFFSKEDLIRDAKHKHENDYITSMQSFWIDLSKRLGEGESVTLSQRDFFNLRYPDPKFREALEKKIGPQFSKVLDEKVTLAPASFTDKVAHFQRKKGKPNLLRVSKKHLGYWNEGGWDPFTGMAQMVYHELGHTLQDVGRQDFWKNQELADQTGSPKATYPGREVLADLSSFVGSWNQAHPTAPIHPLAFDEDPDKSIDKFFSFIKEKMDNSEDSYSWGTLRSRNLFNFLYNPAFGERGTNKAMRSAEKRTDVIRDFFKTWAGLPQESPTQLG